MAYYIFPKEHECILPTLRLVFTLFAIVVDGLPQIVHSWNFIFLFTRLSQYCGDIFRLCLPTLLIETHWCLFLYQFAYRPMSDEWLPPQVVFSCLRSGRAARSYCGCHCSWWVCILQPTLMGSLLIVCRFTCGLSWLCGHFLFLTLRSGLVGFLFPTLRLGLIHFPYSGQCRDHTQLFCGVYSSPDTPGSSTSVSDSVPLLPGSTSAPILGIFLCTNTCDFIATLPVAF
jgi:hypothetical protein